MEDCFENKEANETYEKIIEELKEQQENKN
jgi:hypothetical protein